jgi:tetratricopeptide (TPR) repeat protein
MKKVSILIVILFTVSGAFAQKGKVNTALSFKDAGTLDKAVAIIEEAIDVNNPKAESSINWPRTWEVRGEIYQAVFQSKDENYKKLHANPLSVAFESYQKAIQLDDKNKFSNSLKIKMQLLIYDRSKQAEADFNQQDYAKALASFEQIMTIEDNQVYKAESPNAVDTVIIFNAGLTAYNAKKFDRAIEYYKKAASYKYNGAQTYIRLTESYLSKKDTAGALEIMHNGINEYPDNSPILVQLINVYEKKNKLEDAMKYLDLAISKDPNNESFQLFRGVLFEKQNNTDEAIRCYEKAIELKPENFDACFNLGVVYYNRGVKQIDVANSVPGNQTEKYEAEKSKADLEFKKALPYLEKAHESNGNDKLTLESLKNVYYRLKILDKHAEIVEKMKSLN